MISRRAVLSAASLSTAAAVFRSTSHSWAQSTPEAQQASFDQLLVDTFSDDELRLQGANRSDRQEEDRESFDNKGLADRIPSKREIAKKAHDLIVGFEVSNEKQYTARYQSPIWPHGQSGVTIGIGYDVGYVKKDWLRSDWRNIIGDADIEKLEVACRLTGADAQAIVGSLNNIKIPWVAAIEQFYRRTLPLYIAETEEALPNTAALSAESLGALVSLVYNRGASFRKTTNRYSEMRNIRLHMAREDYDRIPTELRNMKKHWEGKPMMRGLLARRELEAKLFEAGLRS